ncbi:MAG: response regulator [Polyangiaceae bacterium]|nr:response regulator [Polyangiaceae bacterium]
MSTPNRNVSSQVGKDDQPGEPRRRNHQLLIIEDDPTFARIVGELASRQAFRPVIANRGDVGLAMARQLKPDAIVLDVRLPGLDGWGLLDQFKHDPATRPAPVVIVSGDDHRTRALRRGAFDCLRKPIGADVLEGSLARINAFLERSPKTLLLVDSDGVRRREVLDFIAGGRVDVTEASTGAEALEALLSRSFDCILSASLLPDGTARDLLGKMAKSGRLGGTPVLIRTRGDQAPALDPKGMPDVVFREVPSIEALLDAVTLFLHLDEMDLTASSRKLLEKVRKVNPELAGKRILIVDDDARNVFAVKSLLEAQRMNVLVAYSGKEGLATLAREPAVDLVLMDVMMPEMDGYEAIRAIRQHGPWVSLPVFAFTAKAMKGDRDRCLEAGASDYIAKPVDTTQLLSLLRVWLGP